MRALLETLGELAVLPVGETAKLCAFNDALALVGELEEGLHEQDVPEGRLPLLRVLVGVGVLRVRLDDHPRRPEVVLVAFRIVGVGRLRRLPDEVLILLAVVVARRVEDVVDAHLDQLGADRDCVLERLRRSADLRGEEHVGDDSVVAVLLQKFRGLSQRRGKVHCAVRQGSAVSPCVVEMLLVVLDYQNTHDLILHSVWVCDLVYSTRVAY